MKEAIVNLGMRPTVPEEDKLIDTPSLCDRCRMTMGTLLMNTTQGSRPVLFEFDDRMFKVECLR